MESDKASELPQNPKETSNIFSNLIFLFTLPIFRKGHKRGLTTSDLYRVLDDHKSENLGDRLCRAWETETIIQKPRGRTASLLGVMVRTFGWNIAVLGILLLFLEIGLKVTQPLFIGGLVSYYMNPVGGITQAYMYAGGIIACSTLNVMSFHSLILAQFHLGMKIRVAMMSMIYRKSLRLSKTALGNTTAGQIVNLLSNDVGKFNHLLQCLHHLWIGPLEIILVVFIIYHQIGMAALAGIAFLIMFVPLQTYLGKKTSTFRMKTAIRSDERIRLMNEIVQGIQVIKMYAWERAFGKLVADARRKEIKMIRYASYIRAIMQSFAVFVTRFSIFISLICYALLGMFITAEKAFVVTAYYNILRQTMTTNFPKGITQIAEVHVSLKRIQRFMLYEETKVKHPVDEHLTMNGDTSTTSISVTDHDTVVDMKSNTIAEQKSRVNDKSEKFSQASLKLSDLRAKWTPDLTENTLDGISFTAKPGEMIAIIGPVGAAKSSIIQAILGELPIESGKIEINGIVSYASQEPWLFSGTVRQNILFGQPMEKKRYKTVLRQCALERDLQLLQFGDRTIVGDRGQSLSGGQKARINLARAVYRQASIYLLDDPLSAVDTHVGRHLFEQCMRDFLKDRIVVLVTHQLQYLQQVEKIIILEHGRISAVGTYEELIHSNVDFASQLLNGENKDESAAEAKEDAVGKERRSRHNSSSSVKSDEEEKEVKVQTQVQETQQKGSIGWGIYKKYVKSGAGVFVLTITTLSCILAQVLASSCDYFLSYWVNKETAKGKAGSVLAGNTTNMSAFTRPSNRTLPLLVNETAFQSNSTVANMEPDMIDVYVYTGIVVAMIFITISRSFLVFNVAMRASRNLHDVMYHGISRVAMYFFNTNPAGRILNRFAKDIGQVDEILPTTALEVITIFMTLAGIVVVISIVNPWFLLPTVCMVVLFFKLRNYYLKTSRDVKRIEAVTRSPIFSHLSASLMGLSTIRAFNAENILISEFDSHQDLHSSAFYTFITVNRTFGFWLDCICVVYITTVTFSFFLLSETQAGNVGLAITQAIAMTGIVQFGMRQSAELENNMTAVERVVEYGDLKDEGPLESVGQNKPPKGWPQKGEIKFDRLSLRYFPDPDTDLVLKKLEFKIMPRQKVGIVGRTGAGKSSIINALFRLAYNDGSIWIDGKDIHHVGLQELRSKISIIPQEPVLFSGTMRYNLDPFEEYSDTKLWQALEEVQLKAAISELTLGLQSRVTEGGTNFSVGQRQLVCLARAILRESKILVLDEATANVDPQTDNLIQTTIREKFRDCTVLTIAHRLHTIMDSDKVLVMDAGHVVEFDAPFLLLTESKSRIFYEMAKETGEATFRGFLQLAQNAYREANIKTTTDEGQAKLED